MPGRYTEERNQHTERRHVCQHRLPAKIEEQRHCRHREEINEWEKDREGSVRLQLRRQVITAQFRKTNATLFLAVEQLRDQHPTDLVRSERH